MRTGKLSKHLGLALVLSMILGLSGVAVANAQDAAPARIARPLSSGMRQIAEAYVRLVLAVGRHDPAYVDAY